MNAQTERRLIDGPAGPLECAIDRPSDAVQGAPAGTALLCHPHPLHGGTMDNKVVQTLARAFVALGFTAVRFNFRGVGGSGGAWDEGRGEVDDVIAVARALRDAQRPLALGGFSFGAAMAARAATTLAPQRLVLVGPAVVNFAPPAVSVPTLVIHGEADEVVPLSAVLDWARPQGLPVTVVPGVGHFFHGQLGLLKQLILGAWHRP
ncbi:MAG: alpha/beta hydrolase [Rubrivivax sp.]